MKLHILGICGTFMGSLALLAREAGWEVSGCDANVYPPMSDLLREQGIDLVQGYDGELPEDAQLLVGNALSRGNGAVEQLLDRRLRHDSGPQWLRDALLRERKVIAVAGTHGKTTTTSMVAWLLESAGASPGFLIGGVPGNFDVSARLGSSEWFVIEADEYDTAFFDKRSKFVHYQPQIAVLNNLEFDHADIFDDLAAIERQFHHLVRLVPASGALVVNQREPALQRVLEQGCWSPLHRVHDPRGWRAEALAPGGRAFDVYFADQRLGRVEWSLLGEHNVANALTALAAVSAAGFDVVPLLPALSQFRNARRRLQDLGQPGGVQVYDDFAHHPTAIETTLAGLREALGSEGRLVVALELRSNTMRGGHHLQRLPAALRQADQVLLSAGGESWPRQQLLPAIAVPSACFDSPRQLAEALPGYLQAGDTLVFMSNGGFDGIVPATVERLAAGGVTPA